MNYTSTNTLAKRRATTTSLYLIDPLSISCGIAIIDLEGHPNHLLLGLIAYLPWLALETIKANIDISRHILQPNLSIGPRVIRIKTSQKNHLGQVVYANSITLTPGTVSVEVEEGEIIVHALTDEAAEILFNGEMDQRVTQLEDEA